MEPSTFQITRLPWRALAQCLLGLTVAVLLGIGGIAVAILVVDASSLDSLRPWTSSTRHFLQSSGSGMTVEECAEAARTAWAREESDVRVLPGKNASYRILEANSGFPGSPSAPPRIEGCVWVGFEDSLRFVVPDTEAFLGHERWHALVFLGAQPLAFLVVGLLGRRMLPPRAASPGLLKIVLVGTVTGAGLTLLGLTVENVLALLGWTTSEQPWLNLLLADGFRSPWHIWLLLVVAAPVAEEMFFRGWVFENLRRHSGRTAGYVVSSLMFAAVHFNPSALPIYIVYSVGLAFAYERTGSVGACIVAHALLNVAALGLAG